VTPTLQLPQAPDVAAAAESFNVAIAEKRAGRFMIRSRTRVVKRHPERDW
jgi:hypothetical protein